MYVCICKSVTDKQIRRAAARGVDNLLELRQSLGVASGCGTCAGSAQEILDNIGVYFDTLNAGKRYGDGAVEESTAAFDSCEAAAV